MRGTCGRKTKETYFCRFLQRQPVNINTHEDEEVTFFGHKSCKIDFIMAAILANCQAYQIEDKVDGAASKQVTNGLSCSLFICDYRKVQELYESSAT